MPFIHSFLELAGLFERAAVVLFVPMAMPGGRYGGYGGGDGYNHVSFLCCPLTLLCWQRRD